MKQKTHAQSTLAENRRARFDYDISETFEAGIELLGHEVKSAKQGKMGLHGAYANLHDGQLFLLNASIPPYQTNNVPEEYDPSRTRRLLLHKKEIDYFIGQLRQKSYTLVPLKAYTKHGFVKLELGLGRSRKKADKRELIKKRDTEREMRRVG